MFRQKEKKKRPNLGDYQIIETRLHNGEVYYQVKVYGFSEQNIYALGWVSEGRSFADLNTAIKYAQKQMGHKVKSRRVVWP